MHGNMRERLNTEITRKQFLQYTGTALLMVLGLNNLFSLLTGNGKVIERQVLLGAPNSENVSGFGARRFGV